MRIIIIFIALIGMLIGSFLNVCIFRLPEKNSIVFPPSHCRNCGSRLKMWDLVPILGFLLLKGRCRYCEQKISIQYPIVELLNTITWALLFAKYGASVIFLKYALLSSLLIVIFFIDLRHQNIPDELNLFGLLAGLGFHIFMGFIACSIDGILGLLIGGGVFLLIALVSGGAMGGGDIKLMGVLGFCLGWKSILLVMLLAFMIGAFVSLFLLGFKIKKRKDFIPFGPFIAVAAVLTMLYGKELILGYIMLVGLGT